VDVPKYVGFITTKPIIPNKLHIFTTLDLLSRKKSSKQQLPVANYYKLIKKVLFLHFSLLPLNPQPPLPKTRDSWWLVHIRIHIQHNIPIQSSHRHRHQPTFFFKERKNE